jgi:hypothetical protein
VVVCEGPPNVVQYNPFLVAACGNSFVNSIGMINVWLVILVIRVTNGEFAVIQKADDGGSDLIYLRKGLEIPPTCPLCAMYYPPGVYCWLVSWESNPRRKSGCFPAVIVEFCGEPGFFSSLWHSCS